MNGRERINAIMRGDRPDRAGFWLGNPHTETKEIYCRELGLDYVVWDPGAAPSPGGAAAAAKRALRSEVDLSAAMGSDFFWISPELDPSAWRHPEGKPIFDCHGGRPKRTLNEPGVFARCDDAGRVADFDWPNPEYLDFMACTETIDYIVAREMAVVGGMWIPFFHVLCDFMGMDNYFIKMHTHPEVVDTITEKVLDFYLEANRRFLDVASDRIDVFFFGNDLGSQEDLLISPAMFDRFVRPGLVRIVEQAKSYNLKVMLHSCGAVSKIIPGLLDAGIDALHPLQARAAGMDAASLAARFGDEIAFVGGVDTQDLLPFQSADAVRDEVRRLKKIFGARYVVSPSHEALLPNVSLHNAMAMRDAALE